jgi:hypothetical protein
MLMLTYIRFKDCIFEEFCQPYRPSANKRIPSSYAYYYRILVWGLSYAKRTNKEMRIPKSNG